MKNIHEIICLKKTLFFLKRSFWRHVVIPSIHKPEGDGIKWMTVNDDETFSINDLQL